MWTLIVTISWKKKNGLLSATNVGDEEYYFKFVIYATHKDIKYCWIFSKNTPIQHTNFNDLSFSPPISMTFHSARQFQWPLIQPTNVNELIRGVFSSFTVLFVTTTNFCINLSARLSHRYLYLSCLQCI